MLQNLPVRSKLVAILALPVLVMMLLVVVRVSGNISDSHRLDRLAEVTTVSNSALALVHELQRERDMSAGFVAGADLVDRSGLAGQRARADQSLRAFQAAVAGLDQNSIREALREQLAVAQKRLTDDLGTERDAVDKLSKSATGSIEFYTSTIETLLNFAAEVPAESDAVAFARDLNTIVAFARAKEAAALERSFVLSLLAGSKGAVKTVDLGDSERLVSIIGAGNVWLNQFDSLATDPQRALYARSLAVPEAGADAELRRQILADNGHLDTASDPIKWMAALNGVVDRLRGVEAQLGNDLLAEISAAQASGNRRAISSSLLILLVLLFSVGISLAMSQSMVSALARLRESARDIAERRLPAVVERLRRLEESDSVDLRPEAAPPAVRSDDEIGEVASAFSAVQLVAVRVATEQAALRKSVGDMFLNFARRSQSLIDRQLELIRELQRKQSDPDKREDFSRLDHLATRMRRNAEDLIVLSGAKPPRRWSEPVSLVDVIQIALAEVEDYKRVELIKIDDLGIAGHAASDVAHLLAELVENATTFSPPQTGVHLAGQTVTNGYVIEIEDQGIGMTDAELVDANERLANPSDVDLTLSSRLGLFVVGRLADRYGIKVQLRHSWYDGLAALVLLPDQLVTLPAELAPPPPSSTRVDAEERPAIGPRVREPAQRVVGVEAARHARDEGRHGAREEVRLPIFEQVRSDWFKTKASAQAQADANGAPAAAPAPEAGPGRPTGPPPRTEVGLPRRVPRVNMAPALAAGSSLEWEPPESPSARSPDDVRRRLSDYRIGFERGRHEASLRQEDDLEPGPAPSEADSPVFGT